MAFLKNKEILKEIYDIDENQHIRLLIQRYIPISYLFTRLAYGNQKFVMHFVKHPRAFKNTVELWQSHEIIDFEMQHDIFLLLKNQLDLLALLLNKISNQDLVDYLSNPEYLKHYFLTPSVLYLLLQYLTPKQRWHALFNFYQSYPNECIWLFKKTSHQQFKNFTELLVDDDYFQLFKILYVHHQEDMFIRSLNEYKHFALALSLLTLEQRFSLVHELPQILSLIQRQQKYLSQAIAGMDYEMLCVWLTAGPNILSLQQGNTSYLQLFLSALDEKKRPQFIQETKLIEENIAYPESLKMLFDMLSTEFLFESLLAMDSHYQIPLAFRLVEKPALFKNIFNRFCTDKKTLLIEKTDAQGQTIFFWTYHAQTLELLLACIPLSQRFDYITHKNHQGFNLLKGFLYLPKALRSVFAMIPSERHQDLLNSHVSDETTLAQTLLNYPKSMKSSFEILSWEIQKSWLMSHDALFVFLEKPSYLSWWLTRIPDEDVLELLEQVNSEGKTLILKAFEYPLAVVILMQNLPYALFKEKIINLYAQGFDVLHQLALKGGLLPLLQQLNTKDTLFFFTIKNHQDISLWELLVEDFDDLRKFIRCIMPAKRFELFTQEHQNQPLIKKQLPHLSEILGWIAPKQKTLFLMHRYQNYPSVFWLAEDALSCLSWLELLEQSHRLHILLQENEEGVSLFDKMFSSDNHALGAFNLLTLDEQIQLLNSKRALLYQYPQKSASILQQQLLSHLETLKTIHPEPSIFSWRFFCYAHPLYREIKSHLDELQQGKNLESILESILGMNKECSGPNLIR